MGKTTKIEYTCDRCGAIISGFPCSVGRFRYMHVFKWWIGFPTHGYKMKYLCHDCFKSFQDWYGYKDED